MPIAIIVLLVLLLLFNLAMTAGVVRDDSQTAFHRLAQVVLVWVVPFLGGFTALTFLGAHHSRSELKALLPFPFCYAGFVDSGHSPFEQTSYDNHDHVIASIGDGSCGGG